MLLARLRSSQGGCWRRGVCGDGPAGSRLCSPEGAPAAAWLEAVPCLPPLPGCSRAPRMPRRMGTGEGAEREGSPSVCASLGVAGLPGGSNSHRGKPRGVGGVSSSPRFSRYVRFSWVSKVSGELGMPLLRAGRGARGRAAGSAGLGAAGPQEGENRTGSAGSTENT